MLLMKLYSDAPRPMMNTFYSHSYMIVLPLHTVSEKGRTIRCCSTKLASNMMTFSLDTRLTALFPGISGFYWSNRQWVAVASAGPYESLHLAPDRQPHTSTPPVLFFTSRMPFLPPNQQGQSTEGIALARRMKDAISFDNIIMTCQQETNRLSGITPSIHKCRRCLMNPCHTVRIYSATHNISSIHQTKMFTAITPSYQKFTSWSKWQRRQIMKVTKLKKTNNIEHYDVKMFQQ